MHSGRPVLVGVYGPTASGKSELAEALANELDAGLVNADAFQVYRGLDIGTAKPVARDRYALLDVVDPQDSFSVGQWVALALDELETLWSAGRSAVVVGGTGLYLRALFEEYAELAGPPDAGVREELAARERDEGLGALAAELQRLAPERAATIDLRNPVRVKRELEKLRSNAQPAPFQLPPFGKVKIGLWLPSEAAEARIAARVESMFEQGWAQEVRGLLDAGVAESAPGMRAIGYRDIAAMLRGTLSRSQAIEQIASATRQYAKRQRTWMRAEPNLHPLEGGLKCAPVGRAMELIRARREELK